MSKRKSLSKKIRFEVFKRDSFTCQYCGKSAPDVILEVDHINPVSNGGKDEIMNLITSCFDCNRGKSNVKISDDSIIEKQKKQIDELNERRLQLEMMLKWRDGLLNIKKIEGKKAIQMFNDHFDTLSLAEHGEKTMNAHVNKYGLIKVLDTLEQMFDKYSKSYPDEDELFDIVFNKLGGWLVVSCRSEDDKLIAYISGICKNKFKDFDVRCYMALISQCKGLNIDLDRLKSNILTDNYYSWYQLRESLESFINKYSN
jgi:CO dehydrogenase/acetyl-CoA synthase alpha subunit